MYWLVCNWSESMVSSAVWKSDNRFCDNKQSKLTPISGYIWAEGVSTDLFYVCQYLCKVKWYVYAIHLRKIMVVCVELCDVSFEWCNVLNTNTVISSNFENFTYGIVLIFIYAFIIIICKNLRAVIITFTSVFPATGTKAPSSIKAIYTMKKKLFF